MKRGKFFRSQSMTARRRRGTLSLELILILPILMVLLLGLFEFALLFNARGEVVDATSAGTRLATLHGVDAVDVEREVKSSLPPTYAKAAEIQSLIGAYSGDEVVVTVRVPMTTASPDLLWPIGYSIQNQYLVAQSRMRKE